MRKIMLSVVASCAVVAFVPATALAHGHKHHRGHHARAHHKTFGHDWSQSGSTSGSTSSQSPAGTVQSFDPSTGVLTLALADGSTVSGKVTSATEIECQGADQSTSWRNHDHGGDNGRGDHGDDNGPGDDDQGQGDDNNNEDNNQACDSSALSTTPAPMVQEAELAVTSAGAVWKKIELVTSSTSSTSSSSSRD